MNNKRKQLAIFGFIWSAIFLIVSIYINGIFNWALAVSAIFFAVSLLYPELYQIIHFYQSWIKFGNFVGKINSKIIIFILFYLIFFPIGMLLKIFQKDVLGKKFDKSASSYFVDRKSQPEGMENQF